MIKIPFKQPVFHGKYPAAFFLVALVVCVSEKNVKTLRSDGFLSLFQLFGCVFLVTTVDGSEIPRPTTWDVSNPENNRINYLSLNWLAGFQPSRV